MPLALMIALLLAGGEPSADWTVAALAAVDRAVRESSRLDSADIRVELRGAALPAAAVRGVSPMVRVAADPLPVLRGNITLPVELLSGDRILARGSVSVTVRTFERVATAAAVLARHSVLGCGAIVSRRVETTGMRGEALSGDSSWTGWRATRMIPEGTVLRRGMLEEIPIVAGGTPVTLRVRAGRAVLSVAAIAREDGRLHDWIQVEQQINRRTVLARVTGPGTVERTLEKGTDR